MPVCVLLAACCRIHMPGSAGNLLPAFAGDRDVEGASASEEAINDDDSASDDSGQLLDVERKAREVDRDRLGSDPGSCSCPGAPCLACSNINMVATSHIACLPYTESVCHTLCCQ